MEDGSVSSRTRPTAPTLAADKSDPRLLSLGLAAVALVMVMVTALSLANNGIFSIATLVIVLITAALVWIAWQTRLMKPKVTLVKGVVLIEVRKQTYRFDLRNDSTDLEVVGRPGEAAGASASCAAVCSR